MLQDKALHIRDLNASHPDDYRGPTWDVSFVANGIMYYSSDLYYTRDEAEIALAGFELKSQAENAWAFDCEE